MLRYVLLSIISLLLLFSCEHEPVFDPTEVEPDPLDTMTQDVDTMVNPMDTMLHDMDTTQMIQPCDPDSVYFQNDVLPILLSNCGFAGCHGDGSSQDGVELSNYDNVFITGQIVPFNLSESELYQVITETENDKVMPPGNPLPAEKISIIAQWILQGASNNLCNDCNLEDVSYSKVIKDVIGNHCQGCHSGSSPAGNIFLTNYEEIKASALNGSLLGTIDHQTGFTPMPLNQDKLDDCIIEQVKSWIDDGAPDN